ncbi:ribokinase [Sphingomonas sp.]|uniref:ribokinase n=1 Tax=Sphingomonas sp. TaxID=28214 RepID=UPI003CC61D1D
MTDDDPLLGSVAVLGSVNMDVVVAVARFPEPGETISAAAVTRHPGGKGANQAVAAARAGAAVRLIGAVGDDADGRALMGMLQAEGIDADDVRVVDAPTGVAYILVDAAGENQIVVASGANALVGTPPPVRAAVLLAQLESPVEAVLTFFAARPPGATTVLNAAPFRPDAVRCLASADVVIVNETELAGFGGCETAPWSPEQVAALARTLLTRPGQRIIVTRGAAGSVTVDRGGVLLSPGVAASVVDTTGAGDCFCGYLCAGLAAGTPLAPSLAVAHAAAALAVGRAGAAPSMPRMAEVTASVPGTVSTTSPAAAGRSSTSS